MANTTGKKFGGRKKGTPNKRSLDAKSLAEAIGVDPLEVLLRGAAGDWEWFGFKEEYSKVNGKKTKPNISLDTRIDCAKDAAPYIYGKRRPVDADGDTGASELAKILGIVDGSITEDEDESEEQD